MPRKVVAVDIDTTSIRLLETIGNRVERWVSASLEVEARRDGVIANPEAVGAQVKRLIKSSGVGKGEVVASLSGLYSTSRLLSLPPQPEQETLREAPRRARDAISGDGMQVEWQLMRAREIGQDMLVLGIPTSMLGTQIAVLHSAGLRPRLLEIRSTALARAVDRERAIILNIEATALDLVLVVNGLPQIMRTLHLQQGLPVAALADQLARALEQTVTYFNNSHPVGPVGVDTPVFLVGSVAEDPALAEGMSRRVEYTMERFVPPIEFPPHLPAVRYAVTIGLTLWKPVRAEEEVLPGGLQPLDINLVPQNPPWWMPTREKALFLAGVVAGLLLAGVLFQAAGTATAESSQIERQLRSVQRDVAGRRADLDVQTKKLAAIDQFQELTSQRGKLVELYRLVTELVPPGVNLGSFNITEGDLSIGGNYETPVASIEFVNALRASGETDAQGVFQRHFTSVSIGSISEGAGSFSYRVGLGDVWER